jgi:hypothetical protein
LVHAECRHGNARRPRGRRHAGFAAEARRRRPVVFAQRCRSVAAAAQAAPGEAHSSSVAPVAASWNGPIAAPSRCSIDLASPTPLRQRRKRQAFGAGLSPGAGRHRWRAASARAKPKKISSVVTNKRRSAGTCGGNSHHAKRHPFVPTSRSRRSQRPRTDKPRNYRRRRYTPT